MKREHIIQGLSIFMALVLVIISSGCVGPTVRTYAGDKLPKSEVAVIKGWYAFYGDYMTVDIWPLKATKVEVLPGQHRLTIRVYSPGFGYSPGVLYYVPVTLNAEAGHEYRIRLPGLGFSRVDIIDVNTGAIIFSQRLN